MEILRCLKIAVTLAPIYSGEMRNFRQIKTRQEFPMNLIMPPNLNSSYLFSQRHPWVSVLHRSRLCSIDCAFGLLWQTIDGKTTPQFFCVWVLFQSCSPQGWRVPKNETTWKSSTARTFTNTKLKCNRLETFVLGKGWGRRRRMIHLPINMFDEIINFCYDDTHSHTWKLRTIAKIFFQIDIALIHGRGNR